MPEVELARHRGQLARQRGRLALSEVGSHLSEVSSRVSEVSSRHIEVRPRLSDGTHQWPAVRRSTASLTCHRFPPASHRTADHPHRAGDTSLRAVTAPSRAEFTLWPATGTRVAEVSARDTEVRECLPPRHTPMAAMRRSTAAVTKYRCKPATRRCPRSPHHVARPRRAPISVGHDHVAVGAVRDLLSAEIPLPLRQHVALSCRESTAKSVAHLLERRRRSPAGSASRGNSAWQFQALLTGRAKGR